MTALTRAPATPPRMPDEAEGDYSVFVAWFEANPRPTPVECGCAEIAARNAWVQRAQAWEWQHRLKLGERTPPELLRDLVIDQILAARIAAAKIQDAEAGSKTLTPEGSATLDRMAKLSELATALPSPKAEDSIDLTKLTQEEREVILRAQAIVRKGTAK